MCQSEVSYRAWPSAHAPGARQKGRADVSGLQSFLGPMIGLIGCRVSALRLLSLGVFVIGRGFDTSLQDLSVCYVQGLEAWARRLHLKESTNPPSSPKAS